MRVILESVVAHACSDAWAEATRMGRKRRYAGALTHRTLKRGSAPTAAATRG